MTNEEIFNKIKQYESKWGKLGHTNIMNPEKNTIYHSGTNKDISQGGNKTMSRLDNELYKFRQKVAAGKEANKLAHKSYISPDDLNKMNYEQLMKSHTLIHAQNPLYGQQNPNAKYYKREGQPGNYRYYYTKEEYDAAHSNGSAADANREAQARSAYETNKKIENYKNKQNVTNTSSNARENNLQADFTKKFSDIARQSPEAAAKEIINDDNTKIKTFYNKIDDGFRKGVIVWKNGRFEKGEDASDSDYENIKDEIESYSDQLEKFVKDVDTAAGSGKKTKDAIAKIMTNEIESMYQKAEKGKENLKANQNSREAAIKKAQDNDKKQKIKDEFKKQDEIRKQDSNTDDAFGDLIQGLQTHTYKYDKHYDFKTRLNEKLGDNFSKVGSDFIYKNKEYDDKIKEVSDKWNDLNNDRDSDGNVQHWDEMNKLSSEWSKLENEKNKAKYSELMSAISEVINEYPSKEKSNIYAELNHLIGYGYMNKYRQDDFNMNTEVKDFLRKLASGEEIKHSFSKSNRIKSSALITNSSIGDEIMDEYAIFQEKVKRGRELNRIAHSTFISPDDLNARYEKDLEKEGILVHAGNYKYYNKIDMPNGTTRYFYTKAEWDAYQDAKGQTNYREDQKADARENAKKEASKRSGMTGYEEWKKEQNNKTNNSSNVTKDIQNYNDTLNQVKEADKSLNVQVAQNMREEAIKNSKVQSTPDVKPSELAVALKQILDDSKTLKAQEAQNKREEAIKKSQEAGKEADRVNKINNDYKNSINENTKLSSEIDKKYDFDDIEDADDLKECWRDLLGDIREIKDDVDNPDKVRYDISENNESYSAYIDDYLKKEIELNKEIETAFRGGQNARNYAESKRYGDEWTKLNKEKEYLIKEHKTKVYNYINNLYKELLK